ncbi:MAG: hypothetical protein ACSHX0_09325 [Akkermansiaceae bacterium]
MIKPSFLFRKIYTILLALLCFVFVQLNSQAKAIISWDAHAEPEIAGYVVYLGISSGEYDTVVDVGNTLSIEFFELKPETTYFFAVSAYDVYLNEGPVSDELSFTTNASSGNSGSTLSITQLEIQFSEGQPYAFFSIAGANNQTFQVSASDDLISWTLLGEAVVSSAGLLVIIDPEADGKRQRFYQLLQ